MEPAATIEQGRAPLVSAVIPTYRRPERLARAVGSVLSQTFADLELVVVPAEPDAETERVLAGIDDPRLRWSSADGRRNASTARNLGVRAARGRWTAFLDDDDEWLPEKLERQLATAERSAFETPVVSCRVLARTRQGDRVWPERGPHPGEPIGDYLFVRRGLFGGGGLLQTSTLLAPTELWRRVPFREDLSLADDLDWALRAERVAGCGFELAGDEPLAVWDIEDDRPRVSAGYWRGYAAWIRDVRELVSRRAYASYLLTAVSLHAAKGGAGSDAFLALWRQARAGGDPSALDLLVHAGHWVVPDALRRRLAVWRAAATARVDTIR
jgi:glycosyltransferase involved in cell wall biosynthesis